MSSNDVNYIEFPINEDIDDRDNGFSFNQYTTLEFSLEELLDAGIIDEIPFGEF